MKNYLFIFCTVLCIIACTETPEQRPLSILSESKMVSIMIDVHMLEASISMKNLPRDSSVSLYSVYEKDLFKKHAITDSSYHESFDYYSSHPELFKDIYEKVVDSLSWREEKKIVN